MKSLHLVRTCAALAGLTALLAACGHQEETPTAPQRPVLSLVVGEGDEAGLVSYSGEVRARYETAQAFRVAGKIISRQVDVGARVKAGQELARLDPADQALGAASAAAQWAAAQAELALAKAELARSASLRERNFISQTAYDQKKAQFDAASAKAEALQAQTRLSQNQSGYTVLRAEQDGVVSQVLAEAGQVVAPGQVVMRLAREAEKEVAINVPEGRVEELRRLGRVEVSLWARQDSAAKPLSAKVREISPVADAATRTYPVQVSIQGADPGVLLGMTATVNFRPTQPDKDITVPLSAIFQQEGKPAVWVIAAGNGLVLRPVTVGSFGEDGARITAGLKAGERIVSAGVHKLIAGEKVKYLEAAR